MTRRVGNQFSQTRKATSTPRGACLHQTGRLPRQHGLPTVQAAPPFGRCGQPAPAPQPGKRRPWPYRCPPSPDRGFSRPVRGAESTPASSAHRPCAGLPTGFPAASAVRPPLPGPWRRRSPPKALVGQGPRQASVAPQAGTPPPPDPAPGRERPCRDGKWRPPACSPNGRRRNVPLPVSRVSSVAGNPAWQRHPSGAVR